MPAHTTSQHPPLSLSFSFGPSNISRVPTQQCIECPLDVSIARYHHRLYHRCVDVGERLLEVVYYPLVRIRCSRRLSLALVLHVRGQVELRRRPAGGVGGGQAGLLRLVVKVQRASRRRRLRVQSRCFLRSACLDTVSLSVFRSSISSSSRGGVSKYAAWCWLLDTHCAVCLCHAGWLSLHGWSCATLDVPVKKQYHSPSRPLQLSNIDFHLLLLVCLSFLLLLFWCFFFFSTKSNL